MPLRSCRQKHQHSGARSLHRSRWVWGWKKVSICELLALFLSRHLHKIIQKSTVTSITGRSGGSVFDHYVLKYRGLF